ncbi:histidinol dehydrogenase [Eudoraea chungangensis]|uniref:histidinol dehydrogenase n=1 Tax=Eudoraea chungangensis TaxID=1481905 RepID=UPI0023EDB45A|nr:histidinol dehydrogenase [Eudoraea chungangensis]
MNTYINPLKSNWDKLLKRPTASLAAIENTVLSVFEEIKKGGDEAVKEYTKKFDKVNLPDSRVQKSALDKSADSVPLELKEAIQIAKSNIEKFHKAQISNRVEVETTSGVLCWQEKRPIQKVGLYIPGGTAPLFSTILMLAVPASIAACPEIILCTPPNNKGEIDPVILYTANLCGIQKVYKVGGIQAIAALTFGTETIPRVYKLFGPGNQYVTVAKQLATKFGVAIDMPAGPSELLVFSDETGIPSFIASDLLSQAEHGTDSQVILVSTSQKLIKEVSEEIELQLTNLPRKNIAEKAMQNGKLIFVEDNHTAIELINEYGPEHFIVCSKEEEYFIDNIQNAGSVFIGNFTPESAGDYASGTNHTLPTNGYAKQYSGVNLDSFMKSMTFQKISSHGLKNLGTSIELMAKAEGLHAHKNAVTLRLKEIEKGFNDK